MAMPILNTSHAIHLPTGMGNVVYTALHYPGISILPDTPQPAIKNHHHSFQSGYKHHPSPASTPPQILAHRHDYTADMTPLPHYHPVGLYSLYPTLFPGFYH